MRFQPKWHRRLAVAPLAALLFVGGPSIATVAVVSCGTTEPASSPCSRVRVQIGFNSTSVGITDCANSEFSISNIQNNQDAAVKSFDFTVSCAASSESYSGRVFDVQYENGLLVGFSLEVDGQRCS